MADFSKQFEEICGLGWHDFDCEDIFIELADAGLPEKNSMRYRSVICEGFGFVALGIDHEGKKYVAFPAEQHSTNPVTWREYDEWIEEEKKIHKPQEFNSGHDAAAHDFMVMRNRIGKGQSPFQDQDDIDL